MSKHSATRFIRVRDGAEVSGDEAFSGEGRLRNGYSLRVPTVEHTSNIRATNKEQPYEHNDVR